MCNAPARGYSNNYNELRCNNAELCVNRVSPANVSPPLRSEVLSY